MANWMKKVLEQGLIETIKPSLQQSELYDVVRSGYIETLRHAGLKELDEADPVAITRDRLEQIVAHILQRPQSEAKFVINELLHALPDLMMMHPKLRGVAALLAATTSRQGRADNGTNDIVTRFFGGRLGVMASKVAQGQRRYHNQQQSQRRIEDLNPAQLQVVEMATTMLASLAQPSIDVDKVNQAISALERHLQDCFTDIVAGVDEQHGAALNSLTYGPWVRLI